MDRRIDESIFAELVYGVSLAGVIAEMFAETLEQQPQGAAALVGIAGLLKRGVQRARDAAEHAAGERRSASERRARGKAK